MTVLVPDAPAVIPPERAPRAATTRLKVSVTKRPLTVRVPFTVRLDAELSVTPGFTVRLFSD